MKLSKVARTSEQAEWYDGFQDRVHGHRGQAMRDAVVEALGFSDEEPKRVLDCGTGTGDLAFRVAARYRAAHVLGIDASEPYLGVAETKARTLGVEDRVHFRRHDLRESLTPLGEFDGAVSHYVFHYDFDRLALFRGLHGALREHSLLVFGINVRHERLLENARWWLEREHNALRWYREHMPDLPDDETQDRARTDRLRLQEYAVGNDTGGTLDQWIATLQDAGFTDVTCTWRDGLDTILRAVRGPRSR